MAIWKARRVSYTYPIQFGCYQQVIGHGDCVRVIVNVSVMQGGLVTDKLKERQTDIRTYRQR